MHRILALNAQSRHYVQYVQTSRLVLVLFALLLLRLGLYRVVVVACVAYSCCF